MKSTIAVTIAFCLSWSAGALEKPRASGEMSAFFHWEPAAKPAGWLLFLPGSDGLHVLQDDRHYFTVAQKLNRLGWSVLLVDYKPAYRASGSGPEGSVADKIAWVTGQAVDWLRREHPETASLPGALVGWSLGAEGVVRVVNDPGRASALGIRCAAVYYPSNQSKQKLNNQVPLLILSGQADDVARAKDVEAFVRDRAPSAASVELQLYPGAYHAFDVASLVERKTLRLLPLIGPKATLQYNEAAAVDAEKRLVGFLADRGLEGAR